MITCPKCQSAFPAEKNMLTKVDGFKSLVRLFARYRCLPFFVGKNGLTEANQVVCPSCGVTFPFGEYKFFGHLSISILRGILLILISCAILFAILVVLKEVF